MSRGIMYHITTAPENLGSMTEGDFYEDRHALNVDYVKDQPPEAARASVQRLVKRLEDAGFKATADESPDGEPAWRIDSLSETELLNAKIRFFRDRFEQARMVMEKLTVEQFATGAPELQKLETLLRDRWGDMVYLGSEFGELSYTLDGAIREFQPNTTYWLAGNTVLLH